MVSRYMDLRWFDDSQVELYDDAKLRKKLKDDFPEIFGSSDSDCGMRNKMIRDEIVNVLKFFMSRRTVSESNFRQDNCDFYELEMFSNICKFHDECLSEERESTNVNFDSLEWLWRCVFRLPIRSLEYALERADTIVIKSRKAGYTLMSEYLIEKYGFLINDKRSTRSKIVGLEGADVMMIRMIKLLLSSKKIHILNESGNLIEVDILYRKMKGVVLNSFERLKRLKISMPTDIFINNDDAENFFASYQEEELNLRIENYISEISSGTNLIDDPVRYCKVLYFLFQSVDDKDEIKRCVVDAVFDIRENVIKQDKLLIVEFIENLKNGRTDINFPNYDYLRNIVMVHGSKGSINFIKKYEKDNAHQYVNQNVSLSDSNFIESLEQMMKSNTR